MDDAAKSDGLQGRFGQARATASLGAQVLIQRVLAEPPRVIGNYEIRGQRAEGAYGVVYEGYARHLARPVAIKRIRRAADDDRPSARGVHEAEALGRLSSPNVVTVHDVFEHGGETFIVMEYVGESLASWQQQPRTYDELRDAYLAAGDGLAAIHAAGLLHLDFKPANVLRDETGRVRVADLGLARAIEEISTVSSDGATEPTRVPIGTRGYSAPEQLEGGSVDARADQYAYCVAFSEPLRRRAEKRAIPRHVEIALERGRSREPGDRWPSMVALVTELRRVPWHQQPRWWVLGMTACVAVPVTFALASADDACPDPRERLAGRWDADVRTRLTAAFELDHTPYSEQVLETVTRDLDAYADRWVDEVNAACASAKGAPLSGAASQLGCLERALERLDRTTMVLTTGRGEVIERADDVVRELTPLDRCALRTEPLAPPDDATAAEAVAEADRARLWLASGRPDDARTAAEHAVLLAERTENDGVRAEALLSRAKVFDAAGEDDRAVEDLQGAASLALAGHRDDVSAEAWIMLAMIAVHDREDTVRASEWLQLAEAAVVRLDRPAVASADVLDARGLLEHLRGDEAAAERSHREALAVLEGHIEPDNSRWTKTWTNLAATGMRQGAVEEAVQLMTQVVELRERRLGPNHPEVAEAVLNLALIDRARGRGEDGLEHLDRAQSILERAFGPSSVRLGPVLTAIAEQRLATGDLDAAEGNASRAWAIQREQLPLAHSERAAGAILLLIEIAIARGDLERALELERERRAEAEARDDPAMVARSDNNIAWMLCQLGRCEEARPVYAALRVSAKDDPSLMAYAIAGLGAVAISRGDFASATKHLEVALGEFVALPERDEAAVAEVRWQLADALARTGGSAESIRGLASAALPYYVEDGTPQEVASVARLSEFGLREQHQREP